MSDPVKRGGFFGPYGRRLFKKPDKITITDDRWIFDVGAVEIAGRRFYAEPRWFRAIRLFFNRLVGRT